MARGVSIGVSYASCGWLVQKYNGPPFDHRKRNRNRERVIFFSTWSIELNNFKCGIGTVQFGTFESLGTNSDYSTFICKVIHQVGDGLKHDLHWARMGVW